MAIKKVIDVDVNVKTDGIETLNKEVDKTVTDVDLLVEAVSSLTDALIESGKEGDKAVTDLDKGSKKAEKSVGGIGTAFKGVGTAIKAAGIGLIIGAFALLKEVVESNQKVLDFFETSMNAISLAFNAVVEVVTTAVTKVNEATGGFDALGKVMSGLLTIVLSPFKIVWDEIRLGIAGAQLLWEKSVFGSGDADKIKGLEDDIRSITKSIAETVEDVIDAGGQIVDNFAEAVSEVGALGKAVIEGVSDISVSTLISQAEAITQLKKAAEIAIVVNQGLIEQNDRLAEQERQIRDNVNISIEERIAANDRLGVILEKQSEQMLKNADLQIAAAQAEFDRLGNQENRIALLDAQNERLAIEAQITGFQSEQLVNQVALENELLDLTDTQIAAENQRAINRSQFNAEQIESELLRIEALKESLELENELETERLENQIEILAEGTQARIDAEQELLDFKEDIHQREIELAKEKTEVEKEGAAKTKEIDKTVADAKIGIAQDTLGLVTELLGENTKAGKAAGVAQATMNTYEGITAVWKAPPVGNTIIDTIAKIASTAVVAASGFSAVRNIQATSLEGTGGSPSYSSPGAPPSIQAPSFNVIGDTNTNQITDAINSQNQAPVKAYVVASDVTSQQELDRATISTASL